MSNTAETTIRLDRWLWYARVAKSRTLCTEMVKKGKCRINGRRITKSAQTLTLGDVVTITRNHHVVLWRVVALGNRRGPSAEAQRLYIDLTAPETTEQSTINYRLRELD